MNEPLSISSIVARVRRRSAVDAVDNQLAFDDDGDFDYEAMADNTGGLRTLLEYTASLADDPNAIASLAGVKPETWQAFATTATRLVGPSGEAIELPAPAFEALKAVVAGMAHWLTMTLIPHGQELELSEELGYR